MNDWIRRYRSPLMLGLLLLTMTVSYFANQHSQLEAGQAVSLPVVQTSPEPVSPLDEYRQQRDADALRDMAALEALVNQAELDPQLRADAAAQLQRLVAERQQESALEGALTASGVYPCAAVAEAGSITIVTEKNTLSEGENALILTLAETHAGVSPSGVRVITAGAGE
ncbi:MAG: SpoIIIAH-like family protein [Clostridia bacterium]|nr:SpoIIIAH-like family protein [Clostridia bacterium]